MPLFTVIFRVIAPEQVVAIAALADEALGRAVSRGVTIRNIIMLPRQGHLYVCCEAPTPEQAAQALLPYGLPALGVQETSAVEWGRLIKRDTGRLVASA